MSVIRAEVRLPAVFSSHMVLQQEKPVIIWGWAFAVTFALPLAPLAFGVLWSVTLVALGLHLRRLGNRASDGKGGQRLNSLS